MLVRVAPIFAMLFPAVAVAGDPPAVRCTIERIAPDAVAITVTAPADPDGSTEWMMPHEWAGIPKPDETLSEPSVLDATGATLAVEAVGETSADRSERIVWRARGGNGPLSLRYVIRSAPKADKNRTGNDYGTIVDASLFRLFAPLGLLMPSSLATGDAMLATVAWRGFDGPGEAAVSSLGIGDREHTVTMSRSELQQAVFMAGRITLGERPVDGGRVCVAAHGAWSFSASDLAAFVAPIVSAERAFFRDTSEPFFLITLESNGFEASEGSFSFGGTACTDAFALSCMPSLSLDPKGPHYRELLKLIAHEYVHTWIGHLLSTSGPEGSAYWFTEGFTDFFARRILHRAALIDDATFAEMLSEQARLYLDNPHRAAPNAVIIERFWNDSNASRLPYQRGDLLATLINEEIRRLSGGTRSIDDLILAFLDRARRERWRPDNDALFAAIAEATSASFAESIRSVAIDGRPIELPRRLVDPMPLALAEAMIQSFEIGFDIEASDESGVVTGLRDGTGAARAGLRNGMALKSASIGPVPGGGPPRGVVTIVDEAGVERTIEYEALSAPRPVPSYRPLPKE